ncbi:MAG: MBL fold metallo-hydrolase [Bacteroidales bacterium]|nr:MBL fold metallo-hydrolase [Bacteroidales bacterium]
MKIQFLGAAREVTGSKHLITLENGLNILLDCGSFQGKGLDTDRMNRDFGFNPPEIDFLILTHAHIDHSGLIPYLYKQGFKGKIYCTPATRDLCAIMLQDSGHIQENDTRDFNRKRIHQGKPAVEPLYTVADAVACMRHFFSVPVDQDINIARGVSLSFTETGHLLGSAAVNLTIKESEKTTRLCYTGDIGRYQNRILLPPKAFPQVDYLITESTYGDRVHKDMVNAEEELLEVMLDTCVRKKGKLIIPSFAIGRTQELVYSFDRLNTAGRLPKIDVFVDSPLAVSATDVFRMHPECYNREVQDYSKKDNTPFGFRQLHYITDKADSMALNDYSGPCVIISSSGMMEAGRIKHHLAHNISDPANTILGVGYCAPSTLGARILRGDPEISIYGITYQVRADIRRIESYSAHGDYLEMLRYLRCQNPSLMKKIFVVHGEYESQVAYKRSLEGVGFKEVQIPKQGETVSI